jgi:iron complex outermembrane receptor protein
MKTTPAISIIAAGIAAGIAAALAPAGDAIADDPAGEAEPILVDPIDVRADRPRTTGPADLAGDAAEHAAAERALAEPAFATVVAIDDRAGETSTVAEVLAKSIGVHVRSLGGLGGFSSLSVRGHAAGHTAVVVDGVPLSRIASVTADLSRFELRSFSRLELFRGGVPVDLGGAAMGGALALDTEVGPRPDGETVRVAAGAGSYGARHLRARWLGGSDDGAVGYHLGASYAGATGDYPYFNDNGTNLNQSDDETVSRTNNGYDQVDAVGRLRLRRGDLTAEGGVRTGYKEQGIPGSASVQSTRTSLATFGQLADLSLVRRRLAGDARLVGRAGAWLAFERQRYRDPDGEVGLASQDRRYRTISGGLRAGASRLYRRHLISAGVDLAADYYDDRDLAATGRPRLTGDRIAAGAAVADDWTIGAADRVVLQPAIRIDVMRTDPVDDTSSSIVGAMDVAPRTDLYASPRVAARARLADGVAVKGSAGRYFRAPTLVESFGDRGYVVGNPSLRAETGLSADAGLVIAPADRYGAVDRLYLELAGFASRSTDTIVQVPTAGLATVSLNLGDALIGGGELGLSARLHRTVTASLSYTFLESRQSDTMPSYQGKRLPQRPRHELYARVDAARRVGGRLLILWSDLSLTSGNYLDAANLRRVPARAFVGAGVKLEPMAGLLVGVEGKNLTDQRVETVELSPPPRPDLTSSPRAVTDFFGYPLPGRAIYATAEWAY